jgi:tetraacyldisaccharide 4'-kinase
MKRPWLAPLVPLYAAGAALRMRGVKARRLGWPVVSIGNLSTGGAGKTPLTIALARLLAARGVYVDVLSRGYGRTSQLAARVPIKGSAVEFGDEPLLIARAAGVPVFVAPQRYDAGVMAEAEAEMLAEHGSTARLRVHLLDDGFQHRQLARDLDILIVNREDWQDTLLPAGNLREPLRAARRASVIAIPAGDLMLEDGLRAWGWQGPVWRLHRKMEVPPLDGPVMAFCGIARPGQFFSGLTEAGVAVLVCHVFRDHYSYSPGDVEWLLKKARAAGATAVISTEKDAVRLGKLAAAFPADLPLKTVGLMTSIEGEAEAADWLLARLNAPKAL